MRRQSSGSLGLLSELKHQKQNSIIIFSILFVSSTCFSSYIFSRTPALIRLHPTWTIKFLKIIKKKKKFKNVRCPHRTMLTCNYSTNPNFSFAQNSQRNWFLYTNFNFLIHFQPDHACFWYFKLLLSDLSMDISCFKYQRYKDEIIGIWASNQFLIKKFFFTFGQFSNISISFINQ